MLVGWRIVKEKHVPTAFSGEGAAKTGGRWNSRGVAVVYTRLKILSPLTSHSGGSDCVMLWSPGGEDDQGISGVIWCGEDESAGGQMISKMGRQSVRYAG